jgi:transposase
MKPLLGKAFLRGALFLIFKTKPTLDGLVNGAVFFAYVEQFLAPALKPGDIVIMDNL